MTRWFVAFLLLARSTFATEPELRSSLNPREWTPVETTVWEAIVAGKTADLLPSSPESENQASPPLAGAPLKTLSTRFLLTILLDPGFTKQIPHTGVKINGARISEKLDLSSSKIPFSLSFLNCLFEDYVDFYGSDLKSIDLSGSHFLLGLRFAAAKIANELNFGAVEISGSADLRAVNIGDQFLCEGKPHINALDLSTAHIGNNATLRDLVSSDLKLSGVSVGNTLSIGGPEIKKLFLGGGSVGYELVVEDSTLGEDIDIADVTVGHNFSFAGNKCLGNVDLHRVNIGSDLIVGETHFFKNLDLTGTRIGGRLSIKSSRWEKDSMLNLTNANVQWIEDDQSHWPYHLYLDGFSYTMWTAWQPDRAAKVRGATADRKISWFETWLKKQNNYSPGPYNQLAGVFRNAGRLDEANCILYASKERERSVSNGFNKIFLWLSMILTGYGYHYERSVVWCLVFVVLGTVILRCSGESRKHQVELGFFYSLDAFLPFVQLRKRFADVDFSGWIKYYFYAHRLAGYIIGSFILAALSGIAK